MVDYQVICCQMVHCVLVDQPRDINTVISLALLLLVYVSFQISYSVTDTRIGEEYFFRGLPSDLFLAEAMIQLLAMFEWNRVGVIYSEELSYARVGTVDYNCGAYVCCLLFHHYSMNMYVYIHVYTYT